MLGSSVISVIFLQTGFNFVGLASLFKQLYST
ncbi:hypothetical protein N483_08840 [Pseudoalteromonas luteoviolacea NCIMB 1944]|nr:hypothetical protein N483_08840 [Pseudoalteromonas luteoviolacea NCIMB 1944]